MKKGKVEYMPRPRKYKIMDDDVAEQSQSTPCQSLMVMAPEGRCLESVKHSFEQVMSVWCRYPLIINEDLYNKMGEMLYQRMIGCLSLNTFTTSDDAIIKGWSREIENKIVPGLIPH